MGCVQRGASVLPIGDRRYVSPAIFTTTYGAGASGSGAETRAEPSANPTAGYPTASPMSPPSRLAELSSPLECQGVPLARRDGSAAPLNCTSCHAVPP